MFLILALLSAIQSPETHNRPATPYALRPLSADSRGSESVPSLVPPGEVAPVERAVEVADPVPLPVPAVVQRTPEGDLEEHPASGDPDFLGFAAGSHYPPPGEVVDPLLLAGAVSAYTDGRPTEETYAFVMFSKRMTPERIARLEAAGVRALGFHPHHTQRVALPGTAIPRVEALDFVRWIGVPRAWQKVHPRLAAVLESAAPNGPVEAWVSVFESDLNASSTRRTAAGATTVDRQDSEVAPAGSVTLRTVWRTDGWQHRELERAGVEVLHFDERVNAFRVRLLPAALDGVTDLDFVQFVEWAPPARPFHDESMPMINADYARASFDGGVNTQAVAGFADTGFEVAHQDLNLFSVGLDASGAGGSPYDDPCGHGTHVAGTLLGEGNVDPSHRGVAPGLGWGTAGQFFAVRIFASCAAQVVDESAMTAFLTTAQGSTPFPHVVNHSWGVEGTPGVPWFGTEASPRIYDDIAYSDAQLSVFAAGDQGAFATGHVTLQASAKNVLTVGSVNDHRESLVDPAELSWTSSEGPCADNRWKPNVVAPGDWITSTSAFDPTGYVGMSGTSMAAPHVTGVAADLIDKDLGYRYLPERISAQLMATAHRPAGSILTSPNSPLLDSYGAGRVDAAQALWNSPAGTATSWAFSLGASGSTFADFTVPGGATRLVAVMQYVEPAASPGASSALVNDWDLWLDQSPITSSTNSGEWFIHQSGIDNNEIAVIDSPQAGSWRWKVHPDATNSTAYFGLSIFVEMADTTPVIAPTFTSTYPYVQPGETVVFDYDLATGGGPISAVHVDFEPAGSAVLTKAASFLEDGPVTNLLNNQAGGTEVQLGNVHPLFDRSAQWEAHWDSEGIYTVDAITREDTVGSTVFRAQTITVDGTPPEAVSGINSTSHQLNVWSNDNTLDMTWTGATDNLSGVGGHAYIMSANAPSNVPQLASIGAVTGVSALVLGSGSYWFNVAPVDKSGNWGPPASSGPYLIDLEAPSAVTNFTSSTHTPGVAGCDFLTISWDAATDAHSGIAGYGIALNGPAPTVVNNSPPNKSFAQNSGSYYLSVRAIDHAGNAGPEAVSPVYTLFRPTPYCSSKINSQGCQPNIQASGFARLSNSTLQIRGNNVLNNKSGLMFWGTAASSNSFQGGTKCVANPVKRTPVQDSGGNPPPDDCSGVFSFDFSSAYMASEGLNAGDRIFAQYWYRDPSAPFTTGLTNGLEFVICP